MLKLSALGRLTLTDQDGKDFAPRGNKARGALVLLAIAPGYTRTRSWLQAHLWSDRAPEQAAGSLRAALSEIRRALGVNRQLLVASRHSVSLDPGHFQIVYDDPRATQFGGETEAFEDVDVRDREFEHVIRDVRNRIRSNWESKTTTRTPRPRSLVLIRCETRGSPSADVGARLLQDRILTALRQTDDLEIISVGADTNEGDPPGAPPHNMLLIRLLAVALSDEVFLSCEINNGRRLWSDHASMPGLMAAMHDSVELDRLCFNTVEHVHETFAEGAAINGTNVCAFVLARQARNLFFRLDKESLLAAENLFKRAFELEPRGRHLVWRAFLRNAAFFQHRSMSFLNGSSATELALEALRHSPEDAIVHTISSQIEYVHQGNLHTPLVMAQRGVERDPTDPLGWALLSNALCTNGRPVEGYQTARRSLELTKHSPFQFYFEHFACMAAVALADYDQALLHARTALRVRPDFVSTRRYEVALNLHSGTPQLKEAVAALRQHEPDFTTATLLEPNYPVNTLRRLPLMATIEKRAVSSAADFRA